MPLVLRAYDIANGLALYQDDKENFHALYWNLENHRWEESPLDPTALSVLTQNSGCVRTREAHKDLHALRVRLYALQMHLHSTIEELARRRMSEREEEADTETLKRNDTVAIIIYGDLREHEARVIDIRHYGARVEIQEGPRKNQVVWDPKTFKIVRKIVRSVPQ